MYDLYPPDAWERKNRNCCGRARGDVITLFPPDCCVSYTMAGECANHSRREAGGDVNNRGFSGLRACASAPFVGAFCLFASSCCSRGNAVQVSPSGEYSAFLSVEYCPDGYGIWVVNLTGSDGKVILEETMHGSPAALMAYLAWDASDRLWWYSSDDGSVCFWERSGTGWTRHEYQPEDSVGSAPPDSLFTQGNGRRPEV